MAIKLKEVEIKISNMTLDDAISYLIDLNIDSVGLKKLLDKLITKKYKIIKEHERFEILLQFEKSGYSNGKKFIAGIDEAGRGPLAGPVVAAAVILPKECFIEGLDDSKKLSAAKREQLYVEIINKAVAYKICEASHEEIEVMNILNATKKAMSDAIEGLSPTPDLLLIDAVKLDNINIHQLPIIQGDAKSASIAAASILAKVTRDRILSKYDTLYPQYGFEKHKGYGTKDHIEAIKAHGLSPIHRKSFCKNFI